MTSRFKQPIWVVPLGLVLIAVNPVAAMTTLFPEPLRTRAILPASFPARGAELTRLAKAYISS